MSLEIEIKFTLNGRPVQTRVAPTMTALTMLREKFDLTGSKLACGEGECGACTVKIDDRTINSCLMFAVDCDGRDIQTIEGLGGINGLEIMQQAFVDHGAVQCGFCTPGMLMTADALLTENPKPDEKTIRKALAGNICRCTGYAKIVEAVAHAAQPQDHCCDCNPKE